MKILKKQNKYQPDIRDEMQSELMRSIIRQSKIDYALKIIFFIITIVSFVGICVAGLVIIYNVSGKTADAQLSDVAAALGAFASIITAIIVLPKIIANHLFPQNSEESRLRYMQNIKKSDYCGDYDNSNIIPNDPDIQEFLPEKDDP